MCDEKDMFDNIDINKRRNKNQLDREYMLDNELYRELFSVEQLNAWVDGFKSLRIRYETKFINWMALHCLAFAIIFIRKFDDLTFSF